MIVMEHKNQIRYEVKKLLSQFSQSEYETRSTKIHRELFSSDIWRKSKVVGTTISIFPEVDTYSVIKQAWLDGKLVAVPRCIHSTKQLNFYLIKNFEQLEKGYFNLYEPNPNKSEEIEMSRIELLIVPGVAFTKEGGRLGQGGGYYDRALPAYHGTTISLAFENQILRTLPMEEHDCQVEQIYTEKGAYIINA